MSGFDVLMQQVRSMGTLTSSLGGHVTSLHAGFMLGHLASPALHSHLVLSHIRLLVALLEEVPDLESFDFDILVGASRERQGTSWHMLLKNTERLRGEIQYIQGIVGELEQAIAEVMAELHTLRNIAAQLSQVQSGLQQNAEVLEEARRALESEVIPEVERLLETLRNLLDTYTRELRLRDFRLWQLETVFRFRVPYMRDIRAKRLRRAAERDRKEREERDGQGEGAEAEGADAEGADTEGADTEGAEAPGDIP